MVSLKRILLLISLILFLSQQGYSYYEYNETCQKAQQEIFSLHLISARQTLKQERANNPDNAFPIYLEHLCEFVELNLSEDESSFEQFRDNYYARRELMDEMDDGSPYHKLFASEMLFHLGVSYLKFAGRFKGSAKIYGSYKILQENLEEYPDFWQNKKMEGVYHLIFGNIPSSVKWAARMLGLSGDLDQGMELLNEYYQQSKDLPGFDIDGIIFMIFAYKFTWDEEGGFQFVANLDPDYYNYTLITYFYANMAAASSRNDVALTYFEKVRELKPEVTFYVLDYVEGKAKLNRLDDDADVLIKRFLDNYPGEDFKKDAMNRLSWNALLNGDLSGFEFFKARVTDVGDDLRDRDREAIIESQLPYIPNTELLKSRLLFDGGYYDTAWNCLQAISPANLKFIPYKLEYFYRKGRISQKTGQINEAIVALEKTIELGADEDYTFATRAALQLAQIYEESGNYNMALYYYQLCDDLYDSDHTTDGIENKTEIGIDRMEALVED